MMDCKKALTETNGDMEKAIEYLREKGIAGASKKQIVLQQKVLLNLTYMLVGVLVYWWK
jgi:hypothetical protein